MKAEMGEIRVEIFPDLAGESADKPVLRLVDLVRQVMYWHRDKESTNYNECDTAPCYWCAMAQKAIDELQNAEAHGRAVARTVQPLVGLSESGAE